MRVTSEMNADTESRITRKGAGISLPKGRSILVHPSRKVSDLKQVLDIRQLF